MFRTVRDWTAEKLLLAARRISSDDGWSRHLESLGSPTMRGGLRRLASLGFVPEWIVDGGACVGDWTKLARRMYPSARVLMIEPQPQHKQTLQSLCEHSPGQLQLCTQVLGPEESTAVDFVVTQDDSGGTGSSMLPENSGVPRKTLALPMTTLDQLLVDRKIPSPGLIKLDVQGYEIEVLKGASRSLADTHFLLLEMSVWPYNEGAPLLADALQWLKSRGFRACDLFEFSRRSDDTLVQMDMLLVREASAWARRIDEGCSR